MKECCSELFNEIINLIELRKLAYKANNENAKAHSLNLLKADLLEKHCFEWVLSNKDT